MDTDHRDYNNDTLYRVLLNLVGSAGSEAEKRELLSTTDGVQQKVWGFDAQFDAEDNPCNVPRLPFESAGLSYNSLAIAEGKWGAHSSRLAPCLNQLSIVEASLCNFDLARELLARAMTWRCTAANTTFRTYRATSRTTAGYWDEGGFREEGLLRSDMGSPGAVLGLFDAAKSAMSLASNQPSQPPALGCTRRAAQPAAPAAGRLNGGVDMTSDVK